MKFEELYLQLLAEQRDQDNDEPQDDNGVHGFDDGEFAGGDDEAEPEEPESPEEPGKPAKPKEPPKPKPLSEKQKLKLKWKQENPGLTNEDMDNTIEFFNRRKNGLREYKDPSTYPNYINLPEIVALMQRFPDMRDVLTDHQKIRDIQNYSWDEMEYYMDRVGAAMAAPEVDFKIEGDTPEIRKSKRI